MTPNLIVIRNFIESLPEWEFVDRVGVCNCRRISGSQTYSQHSWCNALDIHFTESFSIPATGAALAAGYRMRNKILDEFGVHINELLWQVPDHWEHIHVSPWPKGWLTPPCAGGLQRIKFENGTTAEAEFPLTIEEEGDDEIVSIPVNAQSHKEEIRVIQGRLGVSETGVWDTATLNAVKALAQRSGTGDPAGIAGEHVNGKMYNQLAKEYLPGGATVNQVIAEIKNRL